MACILFVDDDPFTLETLSRAVQLVGHQALLAGNGQEAFTLAEEKLPSLIFTDMQLPDTDGIRLVTRLRANESTSQIPIFILSASPALDAASRAQVAGAVAYLDKPIRLQTLLELLQRYIPS
jgi:CheY-like chemotaxis protein